MTAAPSSSKQTQERIPGLRAERGSNIVTLLRPSAIALVVALVAAAAFTVVRDTRDLEDTAFLVALAISCGGAALVAAVIARSTGRRWLVTALSAGVLVPVVYVGWIVVRLLACLVTGCEDMS